jgi:homoserine dehydrogenase
MRADLALVGFGHVGRRFARLLTERRDWLSLDYDLECRVVAVATKRHGAIFDPKGIEVVDLAESLERGASTIEVDPGAPDVLEMIKRLGETDADLRILVETTTLDIRAGQPAIDYVRAALQNGCDVITTNKGPVAFAYEELDALSTDRGRSFLFEGAVMDGVPIFNLVRETLPAVQILGFRGVLNSTTNHILSAIEDGQSFDAALARMQSEGIAEADPSLDIDGWDAAAKTSALANVLMRARTTPQAVEREGIGQGTARLAMAAKARGMRVRLVASARRTTSGVTTTVRPIELPETDPLGGLRGLANALILHTDLLGELAITQLSGGLTQTAYAVLTDLVALRRRRQPTRAGAATGRSL